MRIPQEQLDELMKSLRWRAASLLFDWMTETATETQAVYEFFCEPVSQYRGLAETNMMQPGMLTAPNGFLTRSLHCFYGKTPETQREAFRESYTLEFKILQKIYYRAPLIAIPYQGIVFPWVDDIPKEWPDQPGDFGPTPHYIAPMMQFSIRLIGKPIRLTAPLRFLPVLNGALDMAVQ